MTRSMPNISSSGNIEPAVDDDDVVAVLEDVHVLADLAHPAERDDAERRAVAIDASTWSGDRCWRLVSRSASVQLVRRPSGSTASDERLWRGRRDRASAAPDGGPAPSARAARRSTARAAAARSVGRRPAGRGVGARRRCARGRAIEQRRGTRAMSSRASALERRPGGAPRRGGTSRTRARRGAPGRRVDRPRRCRGPGRSGRRA